MKKFYSLFVILLLGIGLTAFAQTTKEKTPYRGATICIVDLNMDYNTDIYAMQKNDLFYYTTTQLNKNYIQEDVGVAISYLSIKQVNGYVIQDIITKKSTNQYIDQYTHRVSYVFPGNRRYFISNVDRLPINKYIRGLRFIP